MSNSDIWYVAFGPDKSSTAEDKTVLGQVRTTKTFKSEDDAKKFAREIIAKGWLVSAGTLNPHQPKQTIAASKIERWADPDGL